MKDPTQKTSSFRMPLIELIIVIGIFAFVSVLLVKIFLGTAKVQQKALDISKATIQVQNIAETFKQTASVMEVANQYQMVSISTVKNQYCLYFDEEWNQILQESLRKIVIQEDEYEAKSAGRLMSCTIQAFYGDKVIVPAFTVKKMVYNN